MHLRNFAAAAAMLCVATASSSAVAAPGDLDTTFGNSGRIAVGVFSYGYDVALQADQKIVVGMAQSGSGMRVARFNTNGQLDNSFGTAGFSDPAPLAQFAYPPAVMIQPDGYIVAAGTSGSGTGLAEFAVVRFDTDGHLDPSFGTGGAVTTSFGANTDSIGNGAALQSDGKIVVVGQTEISMSNDRSFALARYETDGTLDSSFGSGGIIVTDPPGTSELYDVAVQPDGRIVVTASTQFSGLMLARYEADGDLDPTFGTNGMVSPPQVNFARGEAIVIQDDGKIVISGIGGPAFGFTVFRFEADGAVDTSFGTGGSTTYDIGGFSSALDVTVQPNGSIVAAGYFEDANVLYDFAVLRLLRNGLVDPTFGGGNPARTNINNLSSYLVGVAVQDDGNIVGSGPAEVVLGDPRLTVARYLGVGPCEPGPEPDADGDALCDTADPCHNTGGARSFLTKPKAMIGTKKVIDDDTDGDDGLAMHAVADLPAGTFAAFEPVADGVRLIVQRNNGSTIADLTIPGGTYAGTGTAGWELNGAGTRWRFSDKTGAPINGLTRFDVRDLGAKVPGRIKVSAKASNGSYPVTETDSPLRAIVVLGDASAGAAGICAEGASTK